MQRDLGLILGLGFDSYLWFGLSFDANNFFMQQGPDLHKISFAGA